MLIPKKSLSSAGVTIFGIFPLNKYGLNHKIVSVMLSLCQTAFIHCLPRIEEKLQYEMYEYCYSKTCFKNVHFSLYQNENRVFPLMNEVSKTKVKRCSYIALSVWFLIIIMMYMYIQTSIAEGTCIKGPQETFLFNVR